MNNFTTRTITNVDFKLLRRVTTPRTIENAIPIVRRFGLWFITSNSSDNDNDVVDVAKSDEEEETTSSNSNYYPTSTPNTMIYTRFGHVPHLTRDLFDQHIAPKLNGTKIFYQIPIQNIIDSLNIINQAGGLREFYRIPSASALHFTLLDPLEKRDTVTNKHIHLYSKSDRRKIDMQFFKSALDACRADTFTTPFDFDTPIGCCEKKYTKCLRRTRDFVDELFGIDAGAKELKMEQRAVLSIGGGSSIQCRKIMAQTLAEQLPKAKVISIDLHPWSEVGNAGKEEGHNDEELLGEIIQETLSCFPVETMRMVEGPFNPNQVVFLVGQGIDMFDSTYPSMMAEKGIAFGLVDGFPSKPGNEQFTTMDMNDEKFRDQHSSLFPNCDCYSCQNGKGYSRAYINHLLCCKEMLAQTLLTIHNLYEWIRMFTILHHQYKNDKYPPL